MITSNLPFDEWTETFGTERLTGMLLYRLTQHVNILEMDGESYRLAQSRARKPARQVERSAVEIGPLLRVALMNRFNALGAADVVRMS